VYVGIAVGAPLSAVTATPRIAVASATAFAASQLIDIKVFDRLRHRTWYERDASPVPSAARSYGSLNATMEQTAAFRRRRRLTQHSDAGTLLP
jgi:hypothetical protein